MLTPECRRVLEHTDKVVGVASDLLDLAETLARCLQAGMPVPAEKLASFVSDAASARRTLAEQRAEIEALYLAQ